MRIRFFRTWLLLLSCLLFTVGGSARAESVSEKLLDKVTGVLGATVSPDTKMMVRFSIDHPAEAATVYSRGVAQDYPFFAMVAAAKAARGRNIPGVGAFDINTCMSPIRVIDSVFAKADETITDSTSGKADTSAAMKTAGNIAAEYAKATTAEYKQKLMDELAEVVPYFGDLPAICLFAFETNFQTEKNLHLVVTQLSKDILSAYVAFKDGDVVTGVQILMTLGAGKELTCQLVDDAIGGGIIGRTPILGALAKGACTGFVGLVIDGVKGFINGGVGLAEDGVELVGGAAKAVGCSVASLFGNGCSKATTPPSAAELWGAPSKFVEQYCSTRAGVLNNGQDHRVAYTCNDGTTCAAIGEHVGCMTAQERAAWEAQQKQIAAEQFQKGLPAWQAEFDKRWMGKCPDAACKSGLGLVKLNATALAKTEHEAQPFAYFATLTHLIFEAADRQAVSVLEERSYRVLPGKWAAAFLARNTEECQDEVCRIGMKFVTSNALLQVQQRAAATPRPVYSSSTAIYIAAENQAVTLIAESAKRMAEFNKTNTANAAIAWELLTNSLWGKQCADAQCVKEVKTLSAQMRVAANLVQLAKPDQSSMAVQGTVGSEYGPKFKAAVMASKERALKQTLVVAATPVRAAGPLQPFMQKVKWQKSQFGKVPGGISTAGGRPAPRPPTPQPGPVSPIPGGKMVSIQAGTDRMGGDYRGFALDTADPQVCRKACADEAACRSYTYVNPGLKGPKAMCFLKNTTPPASPSACCTSGAVVEPYRR